MFGDISKNCVAGGASSGLWVCVFNPIDCLRVRWQTRKGGTTSLMSFFRHVIRTEGIWRGLWLPGCLANGSAIFISAGTRIGFYPLVRDRLRRGGKKEPHHMFLAGLGLGVVGYWPSAPLLQGKTRLQAQLERRPVFPGTQAPLFTGTRDFLRKTLASDGVKGL